MSWTERRLGFQREPTKRSVRNKNSQSEGVPVACDDRGCAKPECKKRMEGQYALNENDQRSKRARQRPFSKKSSHFEASRLTQCPHTPGKNVSPSGEMGYIAGEYEEKDEIGSVIAKLLFLARLLGRSCDQNSQFSRMT
jgi:hypothetical protein